MGTVRGTVLEHNLTRDTAPRRKRGRLDKGSNTIAAARGRPMPIAHRLHLARWKHGQRVFPEMELDAVAPVAFGDGRRFLLVSEEKFYGVRQVSKIWLIDVAILDVQFVKQVGFFMLRGISGLWDPALGFPIRLAACFFLLAFVRRCCAGSLCFMTWHAFGAARSMGFWHADISVYSTF